MEYRINRKTGDKISTLGFGTSYIGEAEESVAIATLQKAYDGGINYYDLATAHAATFPYFGKALKDVRKDVMYQVHFGANYETGEYGWTTSGDKVKEQISFMLKNLQTDYIDYGFIHCIDEEKIQ